MKDLYRGVFSFSSEVYIERAYASSERQAWFLFCKRLAKKKGISDRQVMQLFCGVKDNYRIIKEFQFEEVDDERTGAAE